MKSYAYLLLSAVLSILGSCSKDGEDPNTPAALEAHIAGVSLITRGGAADATDISSLGIYAVNATEGENTYGKAPVGTQCFYKLDGGKATPGGIDQTLWLNLEKATIYSFHPASPTVKVNSTIDGHTITIPLSAITISNTDIEGQGKKDFDFADAASDYMYGVEYDSNQTAGNEYLSSQPVADNGRAPSGAKGPTISIGLKHAFAQIRLEIKKGDYPGETEISSVNYNRNMRMLASNGSTTMNLKNGELANLTEANEVTYSYTFSSYPVPDTGENDAVTITNYVLPNSQASSTVTIVVDGKTMEMPHPSDIAWKAGSIYTYTILINGTGLQLDGIHVVGWNDNPQPGVTI